MRPFDQRFDLVLVDALQGDGVDLDREPGLLGGVDSRHDLRKVAPAGDAAELLGIEGVERHVDAPHAAGGEVAGEAGELRAVGGHRQLVERAGLEVPRQRAEQGHDVAPHERLAARDAKLADALGDED